MAQLARATRSPLSWLLLLFCYALRKAGGDIRVLVPYNSTGVLGGSTTLHCSLTSNENVTITQITWMKKDSGGSHALVAVFHPKKGPNIKEPERVKFLAAQQDLRNASLAISNLSVEDEGIYECQIATFPRGSRSTNAWLKVQARPKNTAEALEPSPTLILQDVAKCISANGHPPGRISWPSNVNGSHREMKEPGSQPGTTTVTSYLSMVPSRQADGKNITCTVEHESLQELDQLLVTLSQPYPPENVSISGYDGNWYVGLTNLTLTCEAHSKPAPDMAGYNWSTNTGDFPNSVKRQGNMLLISTVEDGLNNTVIVCEVTNALGSGQGQVHIIVKEKPENMQQNTRLHLGYIFLIVFVLAVVIIIAALYTIRRCRHGRALQSNPSERENVQYSSVNGDCRLNMEPNSTR
ncbi:poliovirus receptor precursor [Mus musculus]|uniref:Poliovirus receptor n=1 Tax=Mus musculus TaxID=10090 RepID=Q8K094_MOUSE|nr:poliovirus receptor precursor [Mus musculus]AAH32283.1 Poliovirus receptor [Mus musculus]AAI38220.1 Poliovirus receptor [Mus musculus]AAI38221.1 Poliovirus receptor [Mus musculus]EDL23203.1 poliovirus receptor [Mus musculus]CAD91411.1 Tage4 receptor [Mus musculus]|eukprot:NP_081790.1 poliovirus receptor precursor [Mus musculus]